MNNTAKTTPIAVAALLALPSTPALTQEPAEATLDPVTVIAHRWPTPLSTSGNAITRIDLADPGQRAAGTLSDAIRRTPGITLAGTGARGGATSPFLRGAESDHSQIVVDGLRVSDANILAGPFLGGSSLAGFGSIDILRGAQGAAYGGEAIGGVIALYTNPGESGPTTLRTTVEGGSFSTFSGEMEATGSLGRTSTYRATIAGETTANDRPDNRFEQAVAAVRIDQPVGETGNLALSLRAVDRSYDSPGSIYQNAPDNRELDETTLATVTYSNDLSEFWSTRLLLGGFSQDLTFETPDATTRIDSSKLSLDWRNALHWNPAHRTILGVGAEHTSVENSGFGAIDEEESLLAVYAEHLYSPADGIDLSAGIRHEDYDTFGSATTYRASAAYRPRPGTKLRASIGTAFRAPAFFDLYAQNDFFVGNPDLDAEESTGWDLGIEQEIGDLGSIGLTYFRNDIDNLISSDFSASPSTLINLDETETSGVEFSLGRAVTADAPGYRLAYTYLEATDKNSGARLLRRPAHTLSADLSAHATPELLLGLGALLSDDRKDVDAATFETIDGDDYLIARAYARFAASENLDLHLRIENLLDEDYDEINGFPGLPFGAFLGATFRF